MKGNISFECSPKELELMAAAWRRWNEHISFDQATKGILMAFAKGELVKPDPDATERGPTEAQARHASLSDAGDPCGARWICLFERTPLRG